jgi:hypothetical protein
MERSALAGTAKAQKKTVRPSRLPAKSCYSVAAPNDEIANGALGEWAWRSIEISHRNQTERLAGKG